MDNKKIERQIISLVGTNLGLNVGINNEETYWGYITSGGTEGNVKGINTGFALYPKAKYYVSTAAHYSSYKTKFDESNTIVIDNINGKIDTKKLLETIKRNWTENGNPAVLLLTFGTTVSGEVDDVYSIKKFLVQNNIPHYIHVDAALYGGIPENQNNSPKINFENINVDSISVSLHKYYGVSSCGGVVLIKNKNRSNAKYISYIGQHDETISGSRDFPPYSALQQMREIALRSHPNKYIKNILYFKKLLEENGIEYYLYENAQQIGNTFLVKKPSDEICDRYSLAEEKTGDGKQYVHIIIFPYMKEEEMEKLVYDLIKEYNNKIKKIKISHN